ncbi:hypothetical protein [[Clostridium] scindens]|uniref:hypothetical protein n=1 Tax=Clostridium scindens (strain JCM 10418 / VPI 12708) TaxID=29347 RepID=UPI0022E4CC7E|nr:hypothetical protein [[Clostridium] scindens]WPB21896.1 hypothetical protein GAFPHCNK_01356 [[Clostridium] scindens]WPB33110.1 hypothetical protein HCEICBPK_01880 [[Clostridium] scindens]WPB33865.1 hypothetical protein HCEICBPK_02638 [[Clostridium] scindens]WPB37103.1 hypothetical protein PBLEJBOC_01809 [[Clostridium] scindens]
MNQNKNVKIIQSYLKKNSFGHVELIGITTLLIISKDILKKNLEVSNFLSDVLGVRFPAYVIKSRTLMAARVGRIITDLEESQILSVKKNIIEYLNQIEEPKKPEDTQMPKRKKKNENEKLEKWLKGL